MANPDGTSATQTVATPTSSVSTPAANAQSSAASTDPVPATTPASTDPATAQTTTSSTDPLPGTATTIASTDPLPAASTPPAAPTIATPTAAPATTASTAAPTAATQATGFRGDTSTMPSFGGWAWGNVPAAAVAAAGFDWFETGYPGDSTSNAILAAAGVRPFAYINIAELDPKLAADAAYTGAILRTNGQWGLSLIDVTDPSWQSWIVRRADYAYSTGSRGVKWDAATPDVPPGKTRDDVNAAMAAMMQQILQAHPDMKFIVNQGFSFALAYPQYVHGIETEGLFSASSYPTAYLQPWLDPWYWGPQYDQMKQIQRLGVAVFCAEYADPTSSAAGDLYAAIVAQGFVPYITNESWNIRGRGYGVPAGW